ncbi:hypothetical protein F441_07797 [Phytophthora nicotianae CJ01A1]|nr:hypothetical protein PPTG_22789 [Phytophthora nicotianae INRA-310]ETK88020.1 hypothetical protein L915_07658 [Phytophthora nicotianae]ETO61348.1 hypothetical protein F444_20633 [Phytophthora nicotianae P1976]ETP17890.1 hypothetical protein F441_07797 [Phytophthora nicotianae CJ01A1]ETL41439.1 hypothetical protein L916_07586 [Phytophthora nicotianae]ETL94599.1 hypothetical protein L917_07472 [Phytophthora nicotianae]
MLVLTKNNVANMNAMVVLDDFEHMVAVGDQQVASMVMVVTARALWQKAVKMCKLKDQTWLGR